MQFLNDATVIAPEFKLRLGYSKQPINKAYACIVGLAETTMSCLLPQTRTRLELNILHEEDCRNAKAIPTRSYHFVLLSQSSAVYDLWDTCVELEIRGLDL